MMRELGMGKLRRPAALLMAFCMLVVSIAADWSFVSYGDTVEPETRNAVVTVSVEDVLKVLERTDGAGIAYDWSELPEDVAEAAKDSVLVETDVCQGVTYYVLVRLTDSLWSQEESAILSMVEDISVIFVNQNSKAAKELPEVNVVPYDNVKFTVSETMDIIWEEGELVEASPSYSRYVERIVSSSDYDIASGSNVDGNEVTNDSRILMPRSAKRVMIAMGARTTPEAMNFITSVTVSKKDGKPLPDSDVPFEGDGSGIKVSCTYTIPDPSTVVPDVDYFFSVPEEIDLNAIQVFDMIGTPLDGGADVKVGTVRVLDVTDRTMAITFNEHAKKGGFLDARVEGDFYFAAGFDAGIIGNGGKKELEFTFGVSKKIVEIIFELKEIEATVKLAKKGEKATGNNIGWTINVKPEMKNAKAPDNKLTELVITDSIPAEQGLTISPLSIEITDKDNVPVTNDWRIDYDSDKKGFTCTINNLSVELDTKYNITFETAFTLGSWKDEDTVKFVNKASGSFKFHQYELNSGKEVVPGTSESTANIDEVSADVSITGGFLSKKGEFSSDIGVNTGKIVWTVVINKQGFDLGNVTVIDKPGFTGSDVPPGFDDYFKDGTAKYWEVDTTANDTPPSDSGTLVDVNSVDDSGKIVIPSVTKKIILQYETHVSADYLMNNATVTFSNLVEITADNDPNFGVGIEKPAEVKVGSSLITKTGEFNAKDHTIVWTINVNKDKLPLTGDIWVKDVIPVGLTYKSGTSANNNPVAYDSLNRTVTVDYTASLNDSDTITITTLVDDPKYWSLNYKGDLDGLANTVKLHADSGMSKTEFEVSSGIEVESNVLKKEKKSSNYYDAEKKEVTWTLTVNTNAMTMTNPVITDYIPEGQEYVEGSITPASVLDGTPVYDKETRILTIRLKSPLSTKTTLDLKTKITDLSILENNNKDTKVSNKAVLQFEEMGGLNQSVTAECPVGSSVVTKKGVTNNNTCVIKWTVVINENRVPISNPVLVDQLDSRLMLYTDSVTVKNITKKVSVPVKVENTTGNTYKFSFEAVNSTDTYQMEFDTYFTVDAKYSNSIEIENAGNLSNITGESDAVNAAWNTGGGSTRPKPPKSIKVTKVDDSVPAAPVKGAKFQLDKTQILETGEDGTLVFKNVKTGKHTLVEVSVPDNYILDSTPIEVSVSGEDVEKTIVNKLKRGSLTITKTDGTNPLPGAVFTLYKKNDAAGNNLTAIEPVSGMVTDNLGMVTFNHLPITEYGYIAKETTPPDTYAPSEETYSFNIANDGDTFQWTLTNTKIKSDVLVKKVDSVTGAPVSGAEITIEGTGSDNRDVKIVKVTEADGKARFDGLKFGTYKITETKAPEGYHLTTKEFAVDVKTHKQEIPVEIKNDPIKGSLKFVKKETNTEILLPGAEIALYRNSGMEVGRYITGEDGTVTIPSLPYGDYYYREMKAPSGYVLDDTKHDLQFHITENQQMVVTVENNPAIGSLKFVKKETDRDKWLPGAEIMLFRENGEEIGRYTTGTDGSVRVMPLRYGDYYYQETKAPSGYVLDDTKHDLQFHITQAGEAVTVVLENKKIPSGGGGGGGGTPSKPGKPTSDPGTLNPGPGVPPAEPSVPGQPDILPPAPPVNPEGTPPTVPTTPNTDGTTTIKIPDIPGIMPGSDVAVTDRNGNIVYRGKPDENGNINTGLEPGDYSLFILDEQGVPLAQMPFTILDEEVPLGSLPKTGESGLPEALLATALLGIFGFWGMLVIVDSKKPIVCYRKKNKFLEK